MNGVIHAPFPDTYRPLLQSRPGEDYGQTVVRYIEEEILGRSGPTGRCRWNLGRTNPRRRRLCGT